MLVIYWLFIVILVTYWLFIVAEELDLEPNDGSGDGEGSNDVRRSSRKRKPNTLLEQFITPKAPKIETDVSQQVMNAFYIFQTYYVFTNFCFVVFYICDAWADSTCTIFLRSFICS